MRVITGSARGRKLKTPQGMDVRPTTDSVKEAIFYIIQFDVEGRRVLDLFAGTGQMGIEALSRGAKECVFVDSSRQALNIVKENLKICNLQGTVISGDAVSYLSRGESFDLVFMDPPYDTDLYERCLEALCRFDILSDGGIIICESRQDRTIPGTFLDDYSMKQYRYGKIKITVLRKQEQE